MNKATTQIYKAIRDRLMSQSQYLVNLNQPVVAHIGRWNNQTENEEQENPYPKPAVFVEIDDIPFQNNRTVKKGTASVTLHVVQEVYGDVNQSSLSEVKTLHKLEYAEELADLLDGKTVDCVGPFLLTNIRPDHDHDNVTVTALDFEVGVYKAINI